MKLSVVTTLYNSAPYLESFYTRISEAARQIAGNDYEIIFVDDGSPDDSMIRAVKLTEKDNHVRAIQLSRNFGHHKAIMTGLRYSQGASVFLIDSDLEEKPEWLADFSKLMQETACDVVYGVQKERKGQLFERMSGAIFYRIFNALSGLALTPNLITTRLMTRDYVNALLLHEEREVFLAGLWKITGFDQRPISVIKGSKGTSSYSLTRKVSLVVNSVTSFSNKPLHGIFYLGLIISSVAGGFVAYLLVNKIFLSNPLSGWTSVMASIWILGGLIISSIGILGIFISKIFIETKRRPYAITRKTFGFDRQQA